MKRLDGFPLIIAATAISGVAGYLVTFIIYREVGPALYAGFAVFWAAMYMAVGGLSGIQQEITRSTRPVEPEARVRPAQARNFAAACALVVFVLVAATSPLWAGTVFLIGGWSLALPLAVAAASYVLVAALSGSLYGVLQWRSLALLIVGDGVLRLLLAAVVLSVTHNLVVLAWAVAIPFPLMLALAWPTIRRPFVNRSELDVGSRALLWNVARTVLASVSTAVLVSGFPLLLGVTAHADDPKLVGQLIFTITLSRAPLIVSVMALQSYFVVRFRNSPTTWHRLFFTTSGIIVAVAIVGAALGWLAGPVIFSVVTGAAFGLTGSLIAMLVASSALVGALCVTGSAVLAKSQHLAYSIGWIVAALVTIGIMLSGLPLLPRVATALLAGPVAGLIVHGAWLGVLRARTLAGESTGRGKATA